MDVTHDRKGERAASALMAFVGVPLLLAATVGLVLLGIELFPSDLPRAASPDFLDNIFDSRPVVWAARLLLVSAAFVLAVGGLFIVVSTCIRMRNGEWLKRAGPFEVSEGAVADLEEQVDFWRSATLHQQSETERLMGQLEASAELIDRLRTRGSDQ